MRVFAATLGTETNTFAPIPTGMSIFEETFLYPAGAHPDKPTHFTAPLWAARERAKTHGWTVIEGLCAFAQPAGVTVRKVYETLRDRILDDLKAALPVDMVVLGMHGAMVADGYDDCEGDLLARVREIVGPGVAIGAELDPHCHLTDLMTTNADVIICFKEYPHTDFLERGFELVDLCAATAARRIRPVMAAFDCRIISTFHTPVEPMKSFVAKIKALEGKDGILSISVAHGFPWGDTLDTGTKVLVVADGDGAAAARLAESLGREVIELRDKCHPPPLALEAGLDQAQAATAWPVVLADTADNPGGGAPCDSTFALRELIWRGVADAALGPIWDPVAVRFCFDAGEGARLPLRIGGKVAPVSGDPVDAEVEVLKLVPDHWQMFGTAQASLGASAAVRLGGIDLVLTTKRQQAFSPHLFTGIGIDLAGKRLIVVKSSQHFYAGFAPIAAKVIYTSGRGTLTQDFKSLNYRKVRRPRWPLDDIAP